MVTGDDPLAAQSIAAKVDIHGATCTAESLRDQVSPETLGCSVFAGVFLADKYHLVQALQSSGHVVGMLSAAAKIESEMA
jgi:H+-transporting ATPase